MAYGLKYNLLCTSKHNANLFALRLLFDGYAGSEVDRDVPINPFFLIKDKADVIRGTSLSFMIREETDFEFLSFYTNNSKYIKAELLQNVLTGWTNLTYETLTKSGRTITSAIETGSSGECDSNEFYLKQGETILVRFTVTTVSGARPNIALYNVTAETSEAEALSEGLNEVVFTAANAGNYLLYFYNEAAASWYTGDIHILKKIWTGFVLPQQYSVPYVSCPINVNFTAADGLGPLKYEDFTLTGDNSELTIIRHCIDKIGLGLGYAIAIDITEVNQDSTRSVLAQTYRNCDEFDDMTCYQVLEKILLNYNAEITQVRNRWLIMRSTCKKLTRMLYESDGTYETTEEAPTVLDLGAVLGSGGVEVRPVNKLNLDLEPGGKSVKIKHDYGRRASVIKNYEFKNFSTGFTNWTKSGTFTLLQRTDRDGNKYAHLSSYSNVDTDYIESDGIELVDVADKDVAFEIDFSPRGYLYSGVYNTISLSCRFMVYMVVGATTYYLTTTGWSIVETILSATKDSSVSDPIWGEPYKIYTDNLPGDGTLYVRLYRLKLSSAGSNIILGADYKNCKFYFLTDEKELFVDKTDLTYSFDNSSEPNKLTDIELSSADAPVVDNKAVIYDKITRLSADGTPTLEWSITGIDTVYTLIQLLAKTLASENRMAKQKLTGAIRGNTDIWFDSIIKHAYNSNREFEIAECEWNIYDESFDAKLLELLAWSDEDITVSDGTTIESAANLTVASVAVDPNPVDAGAVFGVTVHIDNSGEMAGRKLVEWKKVDDEDEIISSGTLLSPRVEAGEDEDLEFDLNAPEEVSTIYVKARMITDTAWVSSPAITVNRILTADPLSIEFQHDEYGAGSAQVITLTIDPDATFSVTDTIVPLFELSWDQDTNEITVYPAAENTGSDISGTITVEVDDADPVVISVIQHGP